MALVLHQGVEIVQFFVLLILIEQVMLLTAAFGDVYQRLILNGLTLSEIEVFLDVLFGVDGLVCELQGLWGNRMQEWLLHQRSCPLFFPLLKSFHVALTCVVYAAEASTRLVA